MNMWIRERAIHRNHDLQGKSPSHYSRDIRTTRFSMEILDRAVSIEVLVVSQKKRVPTGKSRPQTSPNPAQSMETKLGKGRIKG